MEEKGRSRTGPRLCGAASRLCAARRSMRSRGSTARSTSTRGCTETGHHADTRLACWGAAGSVLIWRYVTKVRGFVGEYADATEGPGSQLQHLCQEHGRQIRGTAALRQALSDRKSNSALLVPGYSQLAQGSTYSEATSAYAKVEGMGGISFLVPPRSLSSPGSIQQQQHRAPCPAAT